MLKKFKFIKQNIKFPKRLQDVLIVDAYLQDRLKC